MLIIQDFRQTYNYIWIYMKEDKISEYKKEISRHISWLKYVTRINKNFNIDIDELNHYFDGDYRGENPEVICQAFKDVLLKEDIDVSLDRYDDKYDRLIFTKYINKPQPEDIEIESRKQLKMINRVPLKPWKDPESLFCDTEFLRKFLGKEPRKGKECKDNY